MRTFAGEPTLHPGDKAAENARLACHFGIAPGFYSHDQNTCLEAVAAHTKAVEVTLASAVAGQGIEVIERARRMLWQGGSAVYKRIRG